MSDKPIPCIRSRAKADITQHYLEDEFDDGRLTLRLYPETVAVFADALDMHFRSLRDSEDGFRAREIARQWAERLAFWYQDNAEVNHA